MEAKISNKNADETTRQVLHEIERAIGEMQFGSVEITLHDGRVTQIERREKVRLAVAHNGSFATAKKS